MPYDTNVFKIYVTAIVLIWKAQTNAKQVLCVKARLKTDFH